jgi:hypothetical protein
MMWRLMIGMMTIGMASSSTMAWPVMVVGPVLVHLDQVADRTFTVSLELDRKCGYTARVYAPSVFTFKTEPPTGLTIQGPVSMVGLPSGMCEVTIPAFEGGYLQLDGGSSDEEWPCGGQWADRRVVFTVSTDEDTIVTLVDAFIHTNPYSFVNRYSDAATFPVMLSTVVGACCRYWGECEARTRWDCLRGYGSTWTDETCAEADCIVNYGACCHWDGMCWDGETEAGCHHPLNPLSEYQEFHTETDCAEVTCEAIGCCEFPPPYTGWQFSTQSFCEEHSYGQGTWTPDPYCGEGGPIGPTLGN